MIEGALTAALIDEIPVLAVLGAATEEGLTVRDAGELRVKETDRIRTVVENLRRLGVEAEEQPDGMVIPGRQKFRARPHSTASAITASPWHSPWQRCAPRATSVIENADAASVSFPGILEHAGANRVPKPRAQLQDQRVQRDGLLNIPPDQLGDFVHARHRLADPGELHLGRQRFQFAADVLIANLARALVQQQDIAQQFVQHLQVQSSFSLLLRPMASPTGTHAANGATPAATLSSASMAARRLS